MRKVQIDISVFDPEDRERVKKKFEGQRPSDILEELIEYVTTIYGSPHETAEYSRNTIEKLPEVLYNWRAANTYLRRAKIWAADKKFVNFEEGDHPYKNVKEI